MFDRRTAARLRQLKFADLPAFVEELATMVESVVAASERNPEQSVVTAREVSDVGGVRTPSAPPAPFIFSRPLPATEEGIQGAHQEVADYGTDRAAVAQEQQEPRKPPSPFTVFERELVRRQAADPFGQHKAQVQPDVSSPGFRAAPIPDILNNPVPSAVTPYIRKPLDLSLKEAFQVSDGSDGRPLVLPGISPSSVEIPSPAPFQSSVDTPTWRLKPDGVAPQPTDITRPSSPALPAVPDLRRTPTPDIPSYSAEEPPLPGGSGYEEWHPDNRTVRIEWPNTAGLVAFAPSGGIPAATFGPSGSIKPGRATVTTYEFDSEDNLIARPDEAVALNLAMGSSGSVAGGAMILLLRIMERWVVVWELCQSS